MIKLPINEMGFNWQLLNSKLLYFHKVKNKLVLVLLMFLFAPCSVGQAYAQDNPRSPELKQMYNHTMEFIAAKNYQSAILILKQEITLEPENILLPEQMGKALLLNGQVRESINILNETIGKTNADTDAYHYLVLAYMSDGKTKQALKIADWGLTKFPTSGMLQNDRGKIFEINGNDEQALNCYLSGMDNNYSFSENYKDASQIYFKYDDNLLGAIYLEIYLNLPHDTTNNDTLKKQLYTGWQNLCKYNIPNKNKKTDNPVSLGQKPDYTMAISSELFELSPTTSDGVSTENLTMLRTRFVMNYLRKYRGTKLSFELFEWQNELIKNGKFDIYNEWLFGKAESEPNFIAWNTFHDGDMNRFLAWKVNHTYPPLSVSSFISFDFGDLFKNPNKRKNK